MAGLTSAGDSFGQVAGGDARMEVGAGAEATAQRGVRGLREQEVMDEG